MRRECILCEVDGMVCDVFVERNRQVQAGDELIVIESMKMNLSISARKAGVVSDVFIGRGESVSKGQVLIALTSQ